MWRNIADNEVCIWLISCSCIQFRFFRIVLTAAHCQFTSKRNLIFHGIYNPCLESEPTRQFRSIKKWHVQPNYPGVHEYMESYGEFALTSFTIMCHNFDHISSVIAGAGNQHLFHKKVTNRLRT